MANFSSSIVNAQYLETYGINTMVRATIDGIEKLIPIDLNNRDYAEIMKQVEAGELTIQAADEE